MEKETISQVFEELDYQPTPVGCVSLRRRRESRLDVDVLEIMPGDRHLMSDLFSTSEIALAQKSFGALFQDEPLSVVVGGLNIGYVAADALEDARVERVLFLKKLSPNIRWCEDRIIPFGKS